MPASFNPQAQLPALANVRLRPLLRICASHNAAMTRSGAATQVTKGTRWARGSGRFCDAILRIVVINSAAMNCAFAF